MTKYTIGKKTNTKMVMEITMSMGLFDGFVISSTPLEYDDKEFGENGVEFFVE